VAAATAFSPDAPSHIHTAASSIDDDVVVVVVIVVAAAC